MPEVTVIPQGAAQSDTAKDIQGITELDLTQGRLHPYLVLGRTARSTQTWRDQVGRAVEHIVVEFENIGPVAPIDTVVLVPSVFLIHEGQEELRPPEIGRQAHAPFKLIIFKQILDIGFDQQTGVWRRKTGLAVIEIEELSSGKIVQSTEQKGIVKPVGQIIQSKFQFRRLTAR